MGLTKRINNASEAEYGVNILDRPSDPVVAGVDVATVGFVGDFPWGPVNEVTEFTSLQEFLRAHAPAEFGDRDSYPSLKAILKKTFPAAIQVLRVLHTGTVDAVKATRTVNDAGAGPSAIVTARHYGAKGNQISTQWTANIDGVATSRDMIVSIIDVDGNTTYSRRHKAVATGGSSTPTITDPGDPWVVVAAHGSIDDVPAVTAATALATGVDGDAAAVDWTGAALSFDGIQGFGDANLGVDVIFAAEPPEALIDDINEQLVATAEAAGCIAVLATPAGLTKATAITYVADYRSTRAVMVWPKVYITNAFDPNLEDVLVDGASFAAVAIASVQPQNSPGGAPGAPYLRGFSSLETGVLPSDYEPLREAGINAFRMSAALGGFILNGGVVTQVADTTRLSISRTRMFDYLTNSVGGYLERFVGMQADLNLSLRQLGPITRQQYSGVVAFLENAKRGFIIRDYEVDPFGGNTNLDLAAGEYTLRMAAGLYGSQDVIILDANIGTTVLLTEG